MFGMYKEEEEDDIASEMKWWKGCQLGKGVKGMMGRDVGMMGTQMGRWLDGGMTGHDGGCDRGETGS